MKKHDELRARIEAASSTAEIHRIAFEWHGKQENLLATIARYAPVWDDGLVLLIVQSVDGPSGLMKNPHRPASADRMLVRWMVNRLHSEATSALLDSALNTLLTLIHQDRLPWVWREAQELVDIVLPKKSKGSLARRQQSALDVLLAHPGVPTETLRRLSDWMNSLAGKSEVGAARRARLAAHPNSEPALWRPSVQELGRLLPFEVVDALARNDYLRRDPEVRPVLVESALSVRSVSLLTTLVGDAAEDCGECLIALTEIRPQAVTPLLQGSSAEVLTRLNNEHLKALLSNADEGVRLAAIQIAGRLGGSDETQLPYGSEA